MTEYSDELPSRSRGELPDAESPAVGPADFLLARIAEERRGWSQYATTFLAGCDARREIVEAMGDDWVTRTLARAYADHPDYREEWKP